jgi:hypothetical protein
MECSAWSRRLRWLYAVCLLGAGLNHVRDILQGGWLPYRGAPLTLNWYWTSLAVLDLAAAVLLLRRPRTGLVLTAAIIVSDVAVNTYGQWGLGYRGWYFTVSLQLQTLFLGLLVGSLPVAWRGARPGEPGVAADRGGGMRPSKNRGA